MADKNRPVLLPLIISLLKSFFHYRFFLLMLSEAVSAYEVLSIVSMSNCFCLVSFC